MNKNQIYFTENRILSKFDERKDRLDRSREFDRLTNVVSDFLDEYNELDGDQKQEIYQGIKNILEVEYQKTIKSELDYKEMKVWHLSIFSCIELLRKDMKIKVYESPEEVLDRFREIMEEKFDSKLRKNSEKEEIEDLSQKMSELGRFIVIGKQREIHNTNKMPIVNEQGVRVERTYQTMTITENDIKSGNKRREFLA